jgi:hypothetical protein
VAVSEAAAWQPVSGRLGEIQIGASLNWAGACLGVRVSRPLVGSRLVELWVEPSEMAPGGDWPSVAPEAPHTH